MLKEFAWKAFENTGDITHICFLKNRGKNQGRKRKWDNKGWGCNYSSL